ncbi:hypothetical protein, partial [Enterocloster sp.]|uniref:hypothetical protein n=1 Tax=Enterocloster sp. TaxID=2719315 RepID=UPI00307E00B1
VKNPCEARKIKASQNLHKKISTHLLTVLIMRAILQVEQRRRNREQKKDFKRPAWFLPPPVPETYL